jgi:hypothetical protein
VPAVPRARAILLALEGRSLRTAAGDENRVLRVDADSVVVSTTRSPAGQPVPLAAIQDALDRLDHYGEIEVSVGSLGHRSDFVGAVLLEVPGAYALPDASPPRIRLTR